MSSLFAKNLHLLDNPLLADRLQKLSFDKTRFTKTKQGEQNLEVQIGSDPFLLHDPEGAMQEAEAWFSRIHPQGLWAVFVIGSGLGYSYLAARKWLEENPGAFLIFLEDDLEVIGRLLQTELGTRILQDPQVKLYWGQPEGLADTLLPHYLFRGEVSIEILESYQKHKTLFCAQIANYLKSLILVTHSYQMELLTHGRIFFKNFYRNLTSLPQSFLASGLFEKFQGIPAIICGAGPSLQKNLSTLEKLGDKAIIFAGGSSMNVVGARGFYPHFGVGIDPNVAQAFRIATNQAFMVPYFYRSRVNFEALQIVHGPKLYVAGSGGYALPSWFEEKLGIESPKNLSEGYNVANFSLSIATALGCNPIIFVGLDLSYSEKGSYAPGLIRFPLTREKESFLTKNDKDELLVLNDINGKSIFTLEKWIMEANVYGDFAKSHPDILLINATEGGIGMPGIPNMALKEVEKTHLGKTYDLDQMIHKAIMASAVPSDVTGERIQEVMTEMLESLKSVDETIKNGEQPDACEPAWKAIIESFDSYFFHYRGKKKTDEPSPEFAEERKNFLRGVIQTNRELLQGALMIKPSEPVCSLLELPKPVKGERHIFYSNGALYCSIPKKGGVAKYYYPDGYIKALIPRKRGKIDGDVELFYPYAALKRKIAFSKGKRDGTEIWCYPDGRVQCLFTYRQNVPCGEAMLYHHNGKVKQKVVFDQEGKQQSVQYFFATGEERIPRERKSFFTDAIEKTTMLHQSLENVLKQTTELTGKEDAAELQKNLDELVELEKKLYPEEDKESIWKTPMTKRIIGKKIFESTEKMTEQIENLYELLKKLKGNDEPAGK